MTEIIEKCVFPEMSKLDYEVKIHKDKCTDALYWCNNRFGDRWSPVSNRSGQWSLFWCGMGQHEWYRFCFAREHDMILFLLRWA